MSGDEEVGHDWGGLWRRGDNVDWNWYVCQYVVIE